MHTVASQSLAISVRVHQNLLSLGSPELHQSDSMLILVSKIFTCFYLRASQPVDSLCRAGETHL